MLEETNLPYKKQLALEPTPDLPYTFDQPGTEKFDEDDEELHEKEIQPGVKGAESLEDAINDMMAEGPGREVFSLNVDSQGEDTLVFGDLIKTGVQYLRLGGKAIYATREDFNNVSL